LPTPVCPGVPVALGHEIGDGDHLRVVHHPEILHVDAEELAAVLAEVPDC